MRRNTKRLIFVALCTPVLVIILMAGGIYVKLKFDFPANKQGHERLKNLTGISISNTVVYVRENGWTDEETYIRFSSNSEEIDQIVNSLELIDKGDFHVNPPFYWWSPKMTEECKYYYKNSFEDRISMELYYNPRSGDAYYYAWTF